MSEIFTLLGVFLTLVGTTIVVYPDVVFVEKCYSTGRLLRAIEHFEAEEIAKNDTGFDELIRAINDIVDRKYQITKRAYKLDIESGSIDFRRVTNYTIQIYTENEEKYEIEEPQFERIRFQIYRKIRRGKTKIRAWGISLVLSGFLIQGYSILYL